MLAGCLSGAHDPLLSERRVAVVLGICQFTIQLPESRSLKDKRRVVKSIIERVQNRFNVSIAEVDGQDLWQVASIGLACVSNSAAHADETLQHVIRFVDGNLQRGYLGEVHTEILHMNDRVG
jgi:uncharacterized protein YlxP (DUF503 family)